MAEKAQITSTDLQAAETTRRQNYFARLSAVVGGAITGILTGKWLLKKSLREYVRSRLFGRNWTDENLPPMDGLPVDKRPKNYLEVVVDGLSNGKADTISGALITPETLDKWAHDYVAGKNPPMPGTLVGDPKANAALKDLIKKRPEFIDPLVESFNKELEERKKDRDELLAKAEKKYAGAASCERLKEEKEKIATNFLYYSDKAKQNLFDKPLFDEMAKHGKDIPGRMGLSLRHAHDKEQIIAFSVGAAVAVGVAINHFAQKYFHRNDKRNEENSHQANVLAQRESTQQTDPALTRS